MKPKFVVAIAAAVLAFGATSCDDGDDLAWSEVPSEVVQTFTQMFPNARGVDWEYTSAYYVADFTADTFETSAWFTPSGDWSMTQTDYDTVLSMLPMEMENAFQTTDYASWILDDVALYSRPDMTFCAIEVDSPTGEEVTLFFDEAGTLLNMVMGDDYEILPTTIIADL